MFLSTIRMRGWRMRTSKSRVPSWKQSIKFNLRRKLQYCTLFLLCSPSHNNPSSVTSSYVCNTPPYLASIPSQQKDQHPLIPDHLLKHSSYKQFILCCTPFQTINNILSTVHLFFVLPHSFHSLKNLLKGSTEVASAEEEEAAVESHLVSIEGTT